MSLELRPIGSVLGRAATQKRVGTNAVPRKPALLQMVRNVRSLCERGAIHVLTLLDALWLTDASQLVVTGRLTVEEVTAKRFSSIPYNRRLSMAYQKNLKKDIMQVRKFIPWFLYEIKYHQAMFEQAPLGYYNGIIADIQSKLSDLRERSNQVWEESNDGDGMFWLSVGSFIYNNFQREIVDQQAKLTQIRSILRNLVEENERSKRWFERGLDKFRRIYALDVHFYNRVVRELPFEMEKRTAPGPDPAEGSSSKRPAAEGSSPTK